jgi:hypothetical protein
MTLGWRLSKCRVRAEQRSVQRLLGVGQKSSVVAQDCILLYRVKQGHFAAFACPMIESSVPVCRPPPTEMAHIAGTSHTPY